MIPDLHDATLTSIEVDWVEKLATFTFRLAQDTVTVVVSSCSRLVLPRDEPWGSSSSVNGIELVEGADGPVRMSVEMQSGDLLVVEGASVEWESAERRP
ncbi:MAG: hypothetical protein HKO82_09420 [Acidimicrobiia bacterium]|nr:hypothetical protein [Acidimicrobiia bacterium]